MVNTYPEFLQSGFWADMRYRKLEINPRCQRCNSTRFLQVHHMIYRSSWHDTQLEDLETLCRKCHRKEHKIEKPKKAKRLKKIVHLDHHLFVGDGNDFNCKQCGHPRAIHPSNNNQKSHKKPKGMSHKEYGQLRKIQHDQSIRGRTSANYHKQVTPWGTGGKGTLR